ncbi:hypothetical protein ACN3XK_15350 [Actinomadura welshii]
MTRIDTTKPHHPEDTAPEAPKAPARTSEEETAEARKSTKDEDKAEAGKITKAEASTEAENTAKTGGSAKGGETADTGDAANAGGTANAGDTAKAGKVSKEKPAEERRERVWLRGSAKAGLVKATVAVALVGSVITAGLQWYQADQAAERDAERRAVRASAAEFGEALLSYDHTKLQEARNRVLGLASDDFAETYDEAFTGGLEGVITKLKADATATVRTVYLGEIESGTAKAVVVMDSEVHSTAGTRRVLGSYLDMRLTRRGDEWKITEVTSVGAANETMTNPDGEQQKPGEGVPSPEASP